MDDKLIDIEMQGHETAQTMRQANVELRGQRDIITGISDKNKNIKNNLKAGKKVIAQISF